MLKLNSQLITAQNRGSVFSRHNERSTKTKDPYLAFKSVLVPVNGSEASNMAVEFGPHLAKRIKGKTVHVVCHRGTSPLPLDADLVAEAQRGEDILSQAEVVAAPGLRDRGDPAGS
jgi:hypothetical protein